MNRSRIFLALSLLCMLVCAGIMMKYLTDGWIAESNINGLRKEFSSKGMKKLSGKNPDLSGWITIEGTRISYPVMYTPDDPEYYLRRDFDRKYSLHGLPFIDGNSDPVKSMNITVFGHHMKDGSMFSGLTEYRDHRDFINSHRYVKFRCRAGRKLSGSYEIFAYGKYRTGSGIFSYGNISDEGTFRQYIKAAEKNASYISARGPEYGDRILTLVTCNDAIERNDERFIVLAFRRISL